jgi:hypothetical protein
MNMTIWGKAKKRNALSGRDLDQVEEITIPDIEDTEDWRFVPEDDLETEDDEIEEPEDPDSEDCDWQEVYSLNGCSSYFG